MDEAAEKLPFECFIVGAQKAGTSTLFAILARHPAVAGSGPKERHFFDDETRDWSMPDYSSYLANRTKPRQRFGIDATPSYLFWPEALPRLRRYNSSAKIIVSLRDPIDRAFSQWLMTYARALSTGRRYPSFSELVSDQTRHPAKLPGKASQEVPAREVRQLTVLPRGLYAHQLRRLRDYFPDEQVLQVDFEEVVTQQDALARRCLNFLGLSPFRKPLSPVRANPSSGAPGAAAPTARDVAALVEYYADDFGDLASESTIDTGGWTLARVLRKDMSAQDVADRMARRLSR
ncbi:hypothetical protein BKA08_001493 [Nocardioides marinisabuli]|uniref:Sulfotransferase domain-containing protein n=1 Tax=Nocardioides marinisabuli TaxID=419476 RepID=A0A7Y9F097_9ACTN|nr:sulfotransferase [Nocardioides marinisabuli]NYD57255.1 hypothetical protein [Nocardioides marinisabuli]